MDRNYTGGWFQTEKYIKSLSKYESCDIIPIDKTFMNTMVNNCKKMQQGKQYNNHLTNESFNKIHQCKMCKNYFTMNRSFGKHDCYSHYGYKDYSGKGHPIWSCCNNPLSSIGCMKCDHFPIYKSRNGKSYTNKSPKIEISLIVVLRDYNCIKTTTGTSFIKRFFNDYKITSTTTNQIQLKLFYLDESIYMNLLKSLNISMVSKGKFTYVPINLKVDGNKKKIYINMEKSKVLFPLAH